MRRFHPVALLASATFASGAWAADLPEVPAQEAAALVNWSGVYIGGFFGGGAIVDNIELPGLGSGNFNGIGGEGWLGGGFLGSQLAGRTTMGNRRSGRYRNDRSRY